MNGYIWSSTGNADIKFINGLVGKSENRKPCYFSRKSWDFPVKIFPPIRCDLMASRQEEEDAAKSAGPSGAKALTDQAPWQDQNPEPGCQVLGRDDSRHNFPEKLGSTLW